jgi:hypothetical protein
MTRVTLGKSRVRESCTPGSVRAKAKWLRYSTMTGRIKADSHTVNPARPYSMAFTRSGELAGSRSPGSKPRLPPDDQQERDASERDPRRSPGIDHLADHSLA